MNKFKKLKSAIISFCKPKKLTSLAVALTTIFAMLPVANISASAYSYTGLSEIGGKVLIQSSENPLVLIDNGSAGKLDAYKFLINGEVGYCIDPQLPAQKTDGKTMEFTQFSGETGKEVIKLDPNSTDEKEKALIVGLSVLYGGYGDYFSTFENGGKSAKSIMDGVSGLEDGAKAIFKDVVVQRCIVHLIRNSIKYVPSKDYKKSHNRLKKFTEHQVLMNAEKHLNSFVRSGHNIPEQLMCGNEISTMSSSFSIMAVPFVRLCIQPMRLKA
ncbi:transposase [Ruminococcus sp.]|uniref:transposase n=1 Tax=Ruminococcus sp. TaxID=41978 RepID=UPI003994E3D2